MEPVSSTKLYPPFHKKENFLKKTELKIIRTLLAQKIIPIIKNLRTRRHEYRSHKYSNLCRKPLEFWSDQQITHWYFRTSIANYSCWHENLKNRIKKEIIGSTFKMEYRSNQSCGLTAGKSIDLINNSYNSVLALVYIGFRSEFFLQAFINSTEYEYSTCRPGDLIIINRKEFNYHFDENSFFLALT